MADFRERHKSDSNKQNEANGGEDTVDDKVMEQAAAVFRGYVLQRLRIDEPRMYLDPEDLGGRANEGQETELKETITYFLKITDELKSHGTFENLVSAISTDYSKNAFFTVAGRIFSDGVSWVKVVALFHIAYRFIHKAVADKQLDVIQEIISWVLQVIRENISPWIRKQKGWEGVTESAPTWQCVIVFAACVLLVALLYWKMSS